MLDVLVRWKFAEQLESNNFKIPVDEDLHDIEGLVNIHTKISKLISDSL